MPFDASYEKFMQTHLHSRSGEALRRLQEGHGHAEKLFLEQVWWPAVGRFDFLRAEYQVSDFKDGVRYLDFAYIRGTHLVCIEIDGYNAHHKDLNRWQFADQLTRQNHLILDGWKILRFAYDEVKEKPRRCQQLILQMMGRWFGEEHSSIALTLEEREILRIAGQTNEPLLPKTISLRLHISRNHAGKLLRRLAQMELLRPASGRTRIRSYILSGTHQTIYG
jgi:very-short-patch-repair endonuclease